MHRNVGAYASPYAWCEEYYPKFTYFAICAENNDDCLFKLTIFQENNEHIFMPGTLLTPKCLMDIFLYAEMPSIHNDEETTYVFSVPINSGPTITFAEALQNCCHGMNWDFLECIEDISEEALDYFDTEFN